MLDFIIESFKHGGWMLLPIYLASVWAWILVVRTVFRLWNLALWHGTCKRLARNPEQISIWVESRYGRWMRSTLAGNLLRRLVALPSAATREDYESTVDEVLKWKAIDLEKEIPLIGGIAAMAPLLGLLGTVTGMITTFDVISAFGTSNPSLMADSISEALVTTQDGLAVALPLMVVHMFLSNYRDRIEADAHELSVRYIQHQLDAEESQ
ncbi:MAG TPA: MotA/TolQ/ExbB proton channel family protein [Fibrobacteraceae bacterium]|nr:MotA/TolQ/ExbB proton channel family protein [Fibrobacteraceae bacterium]